MKPKEDNRIGWVQVSPPLPEGDKAFVLLEAPKGKSQFKARIVRYPAEWDFEELSHALDRLIDMIWEENNPDESMLKDYLDFVNPEGRNIPTSIRVPNSLREMMQEERKIARQKRKKEMKELGLSPRRKGNLRAMAKGERE